MLRTRFFNIFTLLSVLLALGTYSLQAAPLSQTVETAIDNALAWLKVNQNTPGSWGDPTGSAFRDTTVTLAALQQLAELGPEYNAAVSFLIGSTTPHTDYLARQATALGNHGADVTPLINSLLAAQNAPESNPAVPNYPEGGWGIVAGYETETLDTVLALDALNTAGLAGGLSVSGQTIAADQTAIFQYDLPTGATSLDVLFNPLAGNIHVRVKVGAPPTLADPYFNLTGPVFLGGLPLTEGTHYIRIDGVAPSSTYSLQVSYVADGFNTNSLLTPINYLLAAQNADGGWGLSVSDFTSNIYLTAHVLLTLHDYAAYFAVQSAVADGAAWLAVQQNGDGGWGSAGSTVYQSGLALHALNQIGVAPPNPTLAENYLLTTQSANGSWNDSAVDTAVVLLALWQGEPATLVLDADWNLIALPLTPRKAAPDATLSNISGDYDLAYTYEACDGADPWKKYDPAAPPFINDLTALDAELGLWIRSATLQDFTFAGTKPTPVTLTLCTGWNLISFPSSAPVPLPDALATIAGQYDLVYTYVAGDLADPWKKFDPTAPPFINDLNEMQAGRGYWIRATQDTSLVVQ